MYYWNIGSGGPLILSSTWSQLSNKNNRKLALIAFQYSTLELKPPRAAW